jgi:hypothetical protein
MKFADWKIRMVKMIKKAATIAAVAAILAAVGITAMHHHAPNAHAHSCDVCNFVSVLSAAIIPAVIRVWILGVFLSMFVILSKGVSSGTPWLYSSRAPPHFPG